MAESINKGEEKDDSWKNDDFLAFADHETDPNAKEAAETFPQDADLTSNGLPPWMTKPHENHVHPLDRLHNEIVGFSLLMEPTEQELGRRYTMADRVRSLAKETLGDDVRVVPFGSMVTGLLMPSSDIDIIVFTQEEDPLIPLRLLGQAIRQAWTKELTYWDVIENTRVPLIKFTIGEVSFDICFNQEGGPKAASMMKKFMSALPPLRPLTFVLKYFLASRELNEAYSGGVGSFFLQLLIVAFLQSRERYLRHHGRESNNSLGVLLLQFFRFYGLEFNSCTTAISVRYDGFFFPKSHGHFYNPSKPRALAFEDPIATTHDIGLSSFRMAVVQRSFATAYRHLLTFVTNPYESSDSILQTVLPLHPDVIKRQDLSKLRKPMAWPKKGKTKQQKNKTVAKTQQSSGKSGAKQNGQAVEQSGEGKRTSGGEKESVQLEGGQGSEAKKSDQAVSRKKDNTKAAMTQQSNGESTTEQNGQTVQLSRKKKRKSRDKQESVQLDGGQGGEVNKKGKKTKKRKKKKSKLMDPVAKREQTFALYSLRPRREPPASMFFNWKEQEKSNIN